MKWKPVIDCIELEEAVKVQFSLDETFDLGRSCFELAENDSYQSLCVDQEALDDTENVKIMTTMLAMKYIGILKSTTPTK